MRKIIPLLVASIVSPLSGPFEEVVVIDPIGGEGFEDSFPAIFNPSFDRPGETGLPFPISNTRISKTASSSTNSSNAQNDYFYCDRYGPFSLDDPQNVNVTFKYRLFSISNQNILERIRLFNSGSVVASSTKAIKSYITGRLETVSFTLPIRDYWTSSGLELRFEILDSSYSILKAYPVTFYPPRNSSVPTYNLKHLLYKSNNIGFYGDGIAMQGFRETFDFRCIGDYIDNDYYYRLDISRNHFLYPNDISISCQNAYLRFDDSGYLFPYVTHEANGEIVLPLSLYKTTNQEIHFKYKNNFYVNKRTLEMSSTYRNNYALTSDFYLPINGLKRFNGTTIYLEFQGLGLDKIAGSLPLKYELNRAIVGSCNDGEYCVEGGVGQ